MCGTHKDAVDRAGLDAEGAEHALRIVDREAADPKAFAVFDPFFADVDAVDRTGLGTLITGDAGREIEAVETPVAGRHGGGQFRVFKVFGKRPPLLVVGAAEHAEGHKQAAHNRFHGEEQVTEPLLHGALPGGYKNHLERSGVSIGRRFSPTTLVNSPRDSRLSALKMGGPAGPGKPLNYRKIMG